MLRSSLDIPVVCILMLLLSSTTFVFCSLLHFCICLYQFSLFIHFFRYDHCTWILANLVSFSWACDFDFYAGTRPSESKYFYLLNNMKNILLFSKFLVGEHPKNSLPHLDMTQTFSSNSSSRATLEGTWLVLSSHMSHMHTSAGVLPLFYIFLWCSSHNFMF